jgi:ketosteroid isomerase-like protein
MRSLPVVLAAMSIVACVRHPKPAPLPALGPARDSLIRLDLTRADSVALLGPVEGMVSLLAEDVVFLAAGAPPVYGRDAARRLLSTDAAAPGTVITWQPLGGELSADHRFAYTFGVAARAARQGERGLDLARYIAFWRRDGAPGLRSGWRIAAYSDVGSWPPRNTPVAPEDQLPPPRQLSLRAAELTATLRATDAAFSDLADRMGLAEAFSTYAAPDGSIFDGPELVIGPRALREFFTATNGALSLTWQPVYAGVAESEDLGFTVGEYVATLRGPSGAAVQRFGKYLTVWKRQRDGKWKFVIDGGSSRPRGGA